MSTIQSIFQQFNQQEADSSTFGAPGRVNLDIIDEAHRLRMSRTPISQFRKNNDVIVKIDFYI